MEENISIIEKLKYFINDVLLYSNNVGAHSVGHGSYLLNIVILLFAAVFIVLLFKYLKLSPVLGYLVAGAAIGEYGLGYIESSEVSFIAEFGVVFLLFAIGIELTIEKLMAMKLQVFGFGTLQTVVTATIIGVIAYQFDGINKESAIVIGGVFALSSTAIVMSVLASSGKKATQSGRLSIAVLLLQDLAVVPLIILISIFANPQSNIELLVFSTVIKALIGVILIFLVGKIVLRPLFKVIVSTDNKELFVATTLLIVLSTSLATESIGLSLALGAFIAGLLVAETKYNYQVEETITPFKSLFMGLFFMSIGMTIDLKFVFNNLWVILLFSITLIVIKSITIILLCMIFRINKRTSIQAGLLLAQGSEFAFIMLATATNTNLIDTHLSQILLLVVTTTMALTPLLNILGDKLVEKLDSNEHTPKKCSNELNDLDNHVIICGYGNIGQIVASILSEYNINYICLDMNSDIVEQNHKLGKPVYFADASKLSNLVNVNVKNASHVIITISNNVTIRRICNEVSKFSNVNLIVKTKDINNNIEEIENIKYIPIDYEIGLQICGELMMSLGINEEDVINMKNKVRCNKYNITNNE